jgi:hypothetical protein
VLATLDTPAGLDDHCSRRGHKREALLPITVDTKASYPSELGITTALVLPQLDFSHSVPTHLSQLFRSSPSKMFLHLRPQR